MEEDNAFNPKVFTDRHSISTIVCLVDRLRDRQEMKSLLKQYFEAYSEELYAAIAAQSFKSRRYSNRLMFALKQSFSEGDDTGEEDMKIVAGAICLPYHISGTVKTLEIAWFCTDKTHAKSGYGSLLFKSIIRYSKLHNYTGVLASSTNKASLWWMSRQEYFDKLVESGQEEEELCRIAGVIFRSDTRDDVLLHETRLPMTPTDEPKEKSGPEPDVSLTLSNSEKSKEQITPQMSKAATPNAIKETEVKLRSKLVEMGIIVRSLPLHNYSQKLYFDRVSHRRDGYLSKSQTFKGRPYRYDTETSNHIWFLIDRNFKTKIGLGYYKLPNSARLIGTSLEHERFCDEH